MIKRNELIIDFGIFDFEITHSEITNMLGIEPSYVRLKGEKRNSKNPDSPVWSNNVWKMSSRLGKYADFDEHLNDLLEIIEQKIDILKPLCAKYPSEFSCAMKIYKNNGESTPWVHLDNRYNKIAAELNSEFDLDLYVF